MLPPSIIPAKPRVRRKRKSAAAMSVVGPPVLVAAVYDNDDGPRVTLTFDRAVSVPVLDGGQLIVRENDNVYDGAGGAIPLDAVTVRVSLVLQDISPGTGIRLTASATTGIVAADPPVGGAAWVGVTDLALPFPP
jgi:hypothetical protein